MAYVLEPHQEKIAARALSLFSYCWSNPYTFRSDCEWVNELGCSSTASISFGTYCRFLWDYGLWRGMRWQRPRPSQSERPDQIFVRLVQSEINSGQPNPYTLAENWVEDKALSNRQFSAASKLLFFSCPDAKLAIFDSRAREAVKWRLRSGASGTDASGAKKTSINLTTCNESFQKYLTYVCNLAKENSFHWDQSVPGIVGTDTRVSKDFVIRRIADKHLFLEGRILGLYAKSKSLRDSIKEVLDEPDEQLGEDRTLRDPAL